MKRSVFLAVLPQIRQTNHDRVQHLFERYQAMKKRLV